MAIIKYILLSLLISYLIRQLLSPFTSNSQSNNNTIPNNQNEKKSAPKKFSDNLGEYTDYEEIK